MTNAVIYTRISADRTGEHLGVERQESECRALAERLGLTITDVYSDNDLSATSGVRRPGFEALLRDRPAVVVCWHTDRLVRKSRDLERVLDLGLTVHAVTAGHIDLSNPAGRAVARTVTAWATYEGEQRTARQLAETRQRAASGRPSWNVRPFGYNLDGTLREPEASALRAAYGDVLAGRSVHDIARAWTVQFPGRRWYPTTVTQILRNARNAGIRTHRGVEVARGTWTPLVDEATWRALVAHTDHRGHNGTRARKYLGSGLFQCATCGAYVSVTTIGYGPHNHARPVYQCPTTARGHVRGRNVSGTDSDVLGFVLRVLSLDTARSVLSERDGPDVSALRAERAQVEARRTEWLQSGMAPRDVATALAPLDVRLSALDEALLAATSADVFGPFLAADTWRQATAAGVALFDSLALHERQGIVRALCARVDLAPGRGTDVVITPSPIASRILAAAGPDAAAWVERQ